MSTMKVLGPGWMDDLEWPFIRSLERCTMRITTDEDGSFVFTCIMDLSGPLHHSPPEPRCTVVLA